MDRAEFEILLDELLRRDIEITLLLEDGVRWYDLNTGMKSQLQIAIIGKDCVWRGRYERSGTIDDIGDVCRVGGECMCGRDYANSSWHGFMNEMA